jgi:hypothetical protein
MKTIPTAEEFIVLYNSTPQKDSLLVAFAKLHLEAAQHEWFEKIKSEGLVTDAGIAYLKNVYPLTNIK